MKVVNINPVFFKRTQNPETLESPVVQYPQIKELDNVTPDFTVKKPQNFTQIGTTELGNGLKIYSYKLANGYRVTIVPMEGAPAVVKNYVNVGSMNEPDNIKGISHFLEHMAFNGTNGVNGYLKLNQGDSFHKIDKMGGWTNASTSYAVTDYVNSTPLLDGKDLEEQIKIIAAMTEDLALTQEMIEKEKGPVCSEINMIMDDPTTILYDQTVRSLFNIKSSADELIAGSTAHIQNLTREDVKSYYDKYYTPDNMNLVITGDVDPQKTIEFVAKNFRSNKNRPNSVKEEKLVPINKAIRKDFISDKATATYVMLGFAGPKTNDIKSKLVFDVVAKYLDSTEVGLISELRKLNSYGSVGSEKISTDRNNPRILSYSLKVSEENSENALKLVYEKLKTIKPISPKTLERIKEGLLQDYQDILEHSEAVNMIIGNDILENNPNGIAEYEDIIKNITQDDVNDFIKSRMNPDNAAITVIHPPVDKNSVIENYNRVANVAFKGGRKPLNESKISEVTLSNNYELALHQTKNDNIHFGVSLEYPLPKNINPATMIVFDEILTMGTMRRTEEEFNSYKENNNIDISASINNEIFSVKASSNKRNFKGTFEKARELLYSPRFSQETLNDAKSNIKDSLKRSQPSAWKLYIEHESGNPYYTSKREILENIDTVTLDDLKFLHKYIIENSIGTVTINNPESNDIENEAKEFFELLYPVNPYVYRTPDVYTETSTPVVLTKAKPASQADIMQLYKFPMEHTAKECATLEIMNSLLSSSSTIGLFNTLREKEHLAYSVYSEISNIGNCGELSCNILTTTDNKEIGEVSYENVQKSIDGFHRQIKALLNSEYSDEDFLSAKRILKSKLLQKEGTTSKLNAVNRGQTSRYGVNYDNILYSEIDNITREDVSLMANKVFKNPPIYSVVASKNTLEANEQYLKGLEQGAAL